ncbi:MAG: DJ-1/PfpI family protein [Clostridia bacterium]|nr:DJ-1/PfpI family protein [Clostridia bacterium]
MKVLLFCLKGFETLEFSPFVDVFGWARNDFDCDIEIITCGFTKEVVSAFGVPMIMDNTIEKIDVSDFNALAVPGGFEEFGFYEEAYDERFLRLIREFDRQNKPIASICVAALPIGKSGVLTDRKATTYHLNGGVRQKQLAEFGVNVIPDKSIVIDRNIITSYCPQTGPYVALNLLAGLVGEEKAKKLAIAMGYDDFETKN